MTLYNFILRSCTSKYRLLKKKRVVYCLSDTPQNKHIYYVVVTETAVLSDP